MFTSACLATLFILRHTMPGSRRTMLEKYENFRPHMWARLVISEAANCVPQQVYVEWQVMAMCNALDVCCRGMWSLLSLYGSYCSHFFHVRERRWLSEKKE